jgi:hypothetical protein
VEKVTLEAAISVKVQKVPTFSRQSAHSWLRLYARPRFTPSPAFSSLQEYSWYSFLLETESILEQSFAFWTVTIDFIYGRMLL